MMYTDTAGTLSFTAPEVMKRRYNKEADIWWVLRAYPDIHGGRGVGVGVFQRGIA